MKYRNKISNIDETNQIAARAFNIAEISQPLAEISHSLVENPAFDSVTVLDPSSALVQISLEQYKFNSKDFILLWFGGEGNDTFSAADWDSLSYLIGGNGDDTIFGGSGSDSLQGDKGNDTLQGGSGNDLINGGSGDDKLFGDRGDDQIKGGSGNDQIEGGFGDDWILGGDGDDVISGGKGADIIDGGSGSDIIDLASGPGNSENSENSSDIVVFSSVFNGTDTIKGFDTLGGNHDLLNLSKLFTQFIKQGLSISDLSAMVKIASNGDLSVTFPSCDKPIVLAHLEGLTADDIARLEYDLHDPNAKHEIIQLTEGLPSFFDPPAFPAFPLPGNYTTITAQPDGTIY